MNVNVWGFGVPDPPPPVVICGQLNVLNHDGDPWRFGSEWSVPFYLLDVEPKTAAATILAKFYPGIVPVWDDEVFASFCQGSFATGCDEAQQLFP